MKTILFCSGVFLLGLFTSCTPYEVQFEGPYEDHKNPSEIRIPYEILTVENGKIRLYQRNLQVAKTLNNLPAGIDKASINHAHDLIAYKIPGQDIVVIDTTGANIGVVANSANATWFDWHTNNQTLYLLSGTTLSFWGPSVTVFTTALNTFFPAISTERIVHSSITARPLAAPGPMKNDLVYWANGQLNVTLANTTGIAPKTSTGSATVTALDW